MNITLYHKNSYFLYNQILQLNQDNIFNDNNWKHNFNARHELYSYTITSLLLKNLCICNYNNQFYNILLELSNDFIHYVNSKRRSYNNVLKRSNKLHTSSLLKFSRQYKSLKLLNINSQYNNNYLIDSHNIHTENNAPEDPFAIAYLMISQYIKIIKYMKVWLFKAHRRKILAAMGVRRSVRKLMRGKKYFKYQIKFKEFENLLRIDNQFEYQKKKMFSHLLHIYKFLFLRKHLHLRLFQRKRRRTILYININATHHNLFMTLARSGRVTKKASTGMLIKRKSKGQRKSTFILSTLKEFLSKVAKLHIFRRRNILFIIRFKGYKYKFRDLGKSISRELASLKFLSRFSKSKSRVAWINYIRFQDLTSLPHNGCRKHRKPRR